MRHNITKLFILMSSIPKALFELIFRNFKFIYGPNSFLSWRNHCGFRIQWSDTSRVPMIPSRSVPLLTIQCKSSQQHWPAWWSVLRAAVKSTVRSSTCENLIIVTWNVAFLNALWRWTESEQNINWVVGWVVGSLRWGDCSLQCACGFFSAHCSCLLKLCP